MLESRDDRIGGTSAGIQLAAIALGFVAIHLVLAVVDSYHPETFLRADRGAMRLREIQELIAAAPSWRDVVAYLSSHGVVGDYGAHAVLYAAGGRGAVVSTQLALLLVSGVGIVGLCRLLAFAPKFQALALGVYFALPHSLVLPHQLATEALQVPLLLLSTWLLCASIRDGRLWWTACGALLLGLATLIRPITLLWPALIFLIMLTMHRKTQAVTYLVLSYVPVVLWMLFVWHYSGTFGLGESNHSLDRNLYTRVAAVAATMPREQALAVQEKYLSQGEQGRMGPREYLEVVLNYPSPFIAAAARDAEVFWGKSGIERVTLDYFGTDTQFHALTDTRSGWRHQLDSHGPLLALEYIWHVAGVALLVSVVGAMAFLAMIVLAIYGGVTLIRDIRSGVGDTAFRVTAIILMILPLYIFTFSLVVMSVRSGHRAPAEFALVILAVSGWQRLRRPARGAGAGASWKVISTPPSAFPHECVSA